MDFLSGISRQRDYIGRLSLAGWLFVSLDWWTDCIRSYPCELSHHLSANAWQQGWLSLAVDTVLYQIKSQNWNLSPFRSVHSLCIHPIRVLGYYTALIYSIFLLLLDMSGRLVVRCVCVCCVCSRALSLSRLMRLPATWHGMAWHGMAW